MSTLRRRLVVLALLVGTIAPAASMSAAPAPVTPQSVQVSYMHDFYYYSDATKTVLVGQGFQNCNGTYTLFWGTETAYATFVSEPCGW